MIAALDIETIPNPDFFDRLPEPEVATGNLKDPEKIAAKYAEAREKQREKMALSPLYGRLFCVGIATRDDRPTMAGMIHECSDAAERLLITHLFEFLAATERLPRLVTWNGTGFDLPFLFKRAAILGVSPQHHNLPPLADIAGRFSKVHTDLMTEWAGWGQYAKLGDVSEAVLNTGKLPDVDFAEFLPALQANDSQKLDRIKEYCKRDCELTLRLFDVFADSLFS